MCGAGGAVSAGDGKLEDMNKSGGSAVQFICECFVAAVRIVAQSDLPV